VCVDRIILTGILGNRFRGVDRIAIAVVNTAINLTIP
jgi:hypothetical protein